MWRQRERQARLDRRLRGDRRHRRGGHRQGLQGGPRRLQRHSHPGGVRSPRRGLCRIPPRAGAQSALGLCPGRGAQQRRAYPRKLSGIRPAPGYQARPEHTEKGSIWELLDVEQAIGMQLTESYAMWPGRRYPAGTSPHPESKYFAVAQIQQDQVEDYAMRKGDDPGRGRTLAGAQPALIPVCPASRSAGRRRVRTPYRGLP